jgi:hypothetical protein
MAGKRIGYNDEVTMGMGKDQKDSPGLNSQANERFQDGTNSTSRYTTSKKPAVGKDAARGMPK